MRADDDRWNRNIQYQPVVRGALPGRCEHMLDVGCGEGMLTRQLSRHADRVTGLDVDAPIIELARRNTTADNITYVVGDLLTHPFGPASFDAVVSIAALHHMDTAAGLRRMGELVRPGGVVAVIGLARSRSPLDLGFDAAGIITTRVHRLTKTEWKQSAPMVWPPPLTYGQTRRTAETALPGVRYRRHVLLRYSLVWTKPGGP